MHPKLNPFPTIESGEKFGTGGAVSVKPKAGHIREAREFWERVFCIELATPRGGSLQDIAERADRALSAWELRWIAPVEEPQPPQS